MQATIEAGAAARGRGWIRAARALQALLVAFLLMDAVMKIARAAPVIEATAKLGFPIGAIAPIGVVLLAITILYAWPRTTPVGAVLLTGYLGGAVATQVMAHAAPFAIAFPILFGALAWAVALVTDARVRSSLRA